MKKFLCRALSAVICLSMLAGCGAKKTTTPVIMTVDGEDVYANEYVAYMYTQKNNFESTFGVDESYWNDETQGPQMLEALKEQAKQQVLLQRAIRKIAKENNITLSKEDIKKMNENNESMIKDTYGDKAKFKEALKASGFTEELYNYTNETSELFNKINDFYFGKDGSDTPSDDEIKKYFEENYVTVKHILQAGFDANDTSRTPLKGDALAKKKAKAEEILKKAKAGEDFDALIKEFGEDPGMKTNTTGYTCSDNDNFDPAFMKAAKALKVGEISGIVEGSSGFHIIKRLPLEASKLDAENGSVKGTTIRDDIVNELTGGVQKKLDEYTKGLDVKLTDEYNEINLKNMDLYLGK